MTRLFAVWTLVWTAVQLLHVVCASTSFAFSPTLRPPRPTPHATGLPTRPTPAPTTTPTWTRRKEYSRFPRTEVHVMEKCCPHISRFAVRNYPSALEDDGWMPGLTFHAFKFNRRLHNCWQIVNAASSTGVAGSQRWKRIRSGSTSSSKSKPSARDSFCLPTENLLPNKRVSVFYIRSGDEHGSFISQPIRNASQQFFDAFSVGGWNASVRPLFQQIFPLAYYYWRQLMPMPQRLITDVRLHATQADAPRQCPKGYEMVAGNLNYNFVGDPIAYFCVQYGYTAFVDPRLAPSSQLPDQKFLVDITIKRKTTKQVHDDPEYAALLGDCSPPLEVVTSQLDFWTRRDSLDSHRTKQLDTLSKTFAQLQLATNYSVITGRGEWLTFCMERQALVQDNGHFRASSEFVNRLYLNLSQIVRRKRLGVVYNTDVSEDAKQSPHGRIHYEDEDAKEERAIAFDEL